jgi:hypothetical protein
VKSWLRRSQNWKSRLTDHRRDAMMADLLDHNRSYLSVHRFMLRQIQRPWLKRYLKRSETLNDISACDNLLRDALSLFSVS